MARLSLVIALCAAACSSARAAAPDHAAPEVRTASVAAVRAARPSERAALRGSALGYVVADAATAETARANALATCPDEMARVERAQGVFCIDRWEASLYEPGARDRRWPGNRPVPTKQHELVARSVPDQKPQAYVSGAEAARACENAGKRLCAFDEWVRACRGPRGRTYPYGDRREAGRCNERFRSLDEHPVVALFDRLAKEAPVAPSKSERAAMWDRAFMNDARLYDMPRSVEPTGAHPGCQSDAGAFDMVGNLHEWVDDPDGTFVGGFFMDTSQNGEGCGYRTRAHDFDYHDYSTGFRCCKDAD